MEQEKIQYILEEFKKIEKIITQKQAEQFYQYYEMLVEKNKVMNLTAITDFYEVVQKHFIDSCICSEYLQNKKNIRLIDVGTGAGFPGLPLKILYPEIEVTLLDSLNKRILFLEEVIDALELNDITTVHYRAEDGARDLTLREQFDYAVSRAVANMSTLSEYCLPFVKKEGCFVAYKAGGVQDELEQAKKAVYLLGGKLKEIKHVFLPESDIERNLVFVKKEASTAKKYPRKAGLPSKQPLQ